LPGIRSVEDRARAISLVTRTVLLEFIDSGTSMLPPGSKLREGQYPTIITGKNLDARKLAVSFDQQNRPQIDFGWDSEGGRIFGAHTGSHIGQYLAVALDQVVISSLVINSRIDDQGVIQGRFTLQEAPDIVTTLKYGALPVPLKIIE
jgi:preprotein translocase subunit SecD